MEQLIPLAKSHSVAERVSAPHFEHGFQPSTPNLHIPTWVVMLGPHHLEN
eukprot:CAMPEP_0194514848 /NCGR_PEP_ID=MMETSP0253-20130528/47403_1 /TAXON_ID=2966 /ORGANISM="Noctiluca scintillans" /LENGTH=49 /DNA_ID=CAMNT_0039358545 /DNA_START=147 /DNA_END=296 /DNA_ORIENTATION=+